MSAPALPNHIPPGAHAEFKFRRPDGVVFDITSAAWEGSARVEEEMPQAAK